MDEQTAEKFAAVFAARAVNGDGLITQEKTGSMSDFLYRPLIGAGIGAGVGGLTGYFGTEDEKKKKRNALYGALTGGLLGTGVPLIFAGGNIAANAINSAAGNSDAGKKPDPAAKSDPAWADPERTDVPEHQKVLQTVNPHNITGRLVGAGIFGYGGSRLGGALSAPVSRAIERPRARNAALGIDAALERAAKGNKELKILGERLGDLRHKYNLNTKPLGELVQDAVRYRTGGFKPPVKPTPPPGQKFTLVGGGVTGEGKGPVISPDVVAQHNLAAQRPPALDPAAVQAYLKQLAEFEAARGTARAKYDAVPIIGELLRRGRFLSPDTAAGAKEQEALKYLFSRGGQSKGVATKAITDLQRSLRMNTSAESLNRAVDARLKARPGATQPIMRGAGGVAGGVGGYLASNPDWVEAFYNFLAQKLGLLPDGIKPPPEPK